MADEMADQMTRHVARKMAKEAPLGSGQRFAAMKKQLAAKGAKDPGALAAYIGRKKYGAKKFNRLSAKGRRHA